MMEGMSDDDDRPKSFEETLRAIADEVTRSIQKVSLTDLDDIARATGVDAERAKRFIDGAGEWLRAQADSFGGMPFPGSPFGGEPRREESPSWGDPLHGAGPDPLDVPSDEQGRALAALDSGRWTVEPGTSALSSHGEGAAPSDALGLVRELRVRDWIDSDGEVTMVGRHALARWLDATDRA